MKTIGSLGPKVHYLFICWAQAEDKDPPEDEMFSSKEITLMNKLWGLVLKASESVPRTKNSLAELG